jgi:NAD(P)-dependent dehydrogenase (short-subunit alcohol dehydrogenase family)
MSHLQGGIAVITGAASGFGLEAAASPPRLGMRIVMADVQADALAAAQREIEALGAPVLPFRLDVSKAVEVEALAAATLQRFGTPHFVFNNAGVGAGGLIWEHTLKDWEWVIGVNLMGVAHGVRVFTPLMLAAARGRPGLARPHRQHRQHGRPGERAQHGRLQRQQARRGVDQRNALPGPGPGDRAGARAPAVPLLRAHRHSPERTQPAGRDARGAPHAQPAHRPGHERQGGEQRQGQRGASGSMGFRRLHRQPLLHLQPPQEAWPACRRGWKTSCCRATPATPSRRGRNWAPGCANNCVAPDA